VTVGGAAVGLAAEGGGDPAGAANVAAAGGEVGDAAFVDAVSIGGADMCVIVRFQGCRRGM
jgi:hypothetical protein